MYEAKFIRLAKKKKGQKKGQVVWSEDAVKEISGNKMVILGEIRANAEVIGVWKSV